MDKKEFYEKSEKIVNETFETVKKYVKVMAQKTGEAAHITQLLIQKAALEHQITKCFSQLGGKVYQKAIRQGEAFSLTDSEVTKIIEESKRLDAELGQVEAVLEKERKVSAVKAAKLKAIQKRKSNKA